MLVFQFLKYACSIGGPCEEALANFAGFHCWEHIPRSDLQLQL